MKTNLSNLLKSLTLIFVSTCASADLVYVHYEGTVTKRTFNGSTLANPNSNIYAESYQAYSNVDNNTVSGTLIISPDHKPEPFLNGRININQPYPDGSRIIYMRNPDSNTGYHNAFVTSHLYDDVDGGTYDQVIFGDKSATGGRDEFKVMDSAQIHHSETATTKAGPSGTYISLQLTGQNGFNFIDNLDLRQNFSLSAEELASLRTNKGFINHVGNRANQSEYRRQPSSRWNVTFELTSFSIETVEGASLEEPEVCY